MRSGLHGAPAKPAPSSSGEKRASHQELRQDADYDCTSVGEKVTFNEGQMNHREEVLGLLLEPVAQPGSSLQHSSAYASVG